MRAPGCDAVGLSVSVTLIALVFWAWLLGPLGAVLAQHRGDDTEGDRAAALRGRVEELRRRHPWMARSHQVGRHYYAHRGNHLASAVAFATVLAAVPLLMLLFSGAGCVLWWRASLTSDLETWLLASVPHSMEDVVRPAVDAAIAQRGSIASIGVLASLWAGATWMSVVREAVSAMWGLPPLSPALPRRLLRDLRSLVVLVAAALVSFALAVTVGALIGSALGHMGLADAPGVRWLLAVGGLLSGTVVNWCVFAWLLGRLPGIGYRFAWWSVPPRSGRWRSRC